MMVDYHVHPNYSPDARGTIFEFCRRAMEIGLKEVCFTTHYEPDPERREKEWIIVAGKRMTPESEWVEFYLDEIARSRKEFPELIIRAGIEVGYEMGLEGKIADFLNRYRFDFVLGAVHCLDHIAITSKDEIDDFRSRLKPRGNGYIARRYFEYTLAAAESGLFDCLAHLDIWRKYIYPEMGEEFLRAITPFLKPMVDTIVRTSTGIEINTSAFRRGEQQPYPSEEIIRQAVDMGLKVFTIGSDAHRVEDLGSNLNRAEKILSRLGLKPAKFKDRCIRF